MNIKFTIEVKLPILDVVANIKEDRCVGHSLYRKPTHTNRYLNASSHTILPKESSVLNTLVY